MHALTIKLSSVIFCPCCQCPLALAKHVQNNNKIGVSKIKLSMISADDEKYEKLVFAIFTIKLCPLDVVCSYPGAKNHY